jgi:putative ABC transport system substrate-binding protein
MNNRRKLIVAIGAGALTAPLASFAQRQAAKVPRIGFLGALSASDFESRVDALRAGLRDLGYVEGQNLIIEFRWAEGKYDRLPELAAELVRLKVDILVTHATVGTRAAKQATTTIPIVMAASGDPVAAGVVASLARPGGNITGSAFFNLELGAKRLELLKEAFPRIKRVAVLLHLDSATNGLQLDAMEPAAKSLKVELQQFKVRGPNEFESAFTAMAKRRVDAVVINEEPMLIANAKGIADLAAKQRLPSIGFKEIAETGGLMAYGVNILEMYRRAAVFIDKILKGTNPSELPIEQATRFELVINRKTAKAVGIKIPNSILFRADTVIE